MGLSGSRELLGKEQRIVAVPISELSGLANRELDTLVVERVLGLEVVARDWPCGPEPECGLWRASPEREPVAPWYHTPSPVIRLPDDRWVDESEDPLFRGVMANYAEELDAWIVPVPFYSVDPGLAAALVEYLRAAGYEIRIEARGGGSGPAYSVTVRGPAGGREVRAAANTFARAVCEAAVLAVPGSGVAKHFQTSPAPADRESGGR
ncbi:hypothetical protein [Desulfovirgula thermocuniculi]|uniref:hypothetical protein n=1 Tax=Desulfovirgula thermocuniculi TaxID=348842 RepID=UPI0012EC37F9|nr:hypothetical protein [Desulfovirgula thermocuniculi]